MFCSAKETKCISEFDYDKVTTGPNIVVKYKDVAPLDKNNKQPHNQYILKSINLNTKMDDKMMDNAIIDDALAKKLILQESSMFYQNAPISKNLTKSASHHSNKIQDIKMNSSI